MSPAPLYTAAAAATRRGSRLVRANGTMNRVALQASAPIVSTEARTRPTPTLYVGRRLARGCGGRRALQRADGSTIRGLDRLRGAEAFGCVSKTRARFEFGVRIHLDNDPAKAAIGAP